MFIELVDVLRCVAGHADTYLVAAPLEMSGRYITRGTLGCPVCKAEYNIIDGIARFSAAERRGEVEAYPVSEYEVLRCAALLDLQGSNGFAALTGAWCSLAQGLLDSTGVHLVLMNPPLSVVPVPGTSIIVADAILPLAKESARAVALDEHAATLTTLEHAASVVRSDGRLVAPATAQLPTNTRLLASDERHVVGQVTHPVVAQVSITRARKN